MDVVTTFQVKKNLSFHGSGLRMVGQDGSVRKEFYMFLYVVPVSPDVSRAHAVYRVPGMVQGILV